MNAWSIYRLTWSIWTQTRIKWRRHRCTHSGHIYVRLVHSLPEPTKLEPPCKLDYVCFRCHQVNSVTYTNTTS